MFTRRLLLFSLPLFLLVCLLSVVSQVSAQGFTNSKFTPCQADVSKDGVVDISDFSLLVKHFLESNTEVDINGDGIVDISDVSIVIALFLQSCTTGTTPVPTLTPIATPEPTLSPNVTPTPSTPATPAPTPTPTPETGKTVSSPSPVFSTQE